MALVFEAIVFGLFGTTLGKLLFGVRVRLRDGGRPTFLQYLGRVAWMYLSGLGLGIPFVALFTMGRQFFEVKEGRPPPRAQSATWCRRPEPACCARAWP